MGVTGPVFLALLAALGGIAAAGLPDRRRLSPVARGRGAGGFLVSAAAVLFLLSGYRVGAAGLEVAGPDAAGFDAAGFGAGARETRPRIGADLDRIRRLLARRAEEPTVFVPPGIRRRPVLYSPALLSFHLPGIILVEDEAQRGLAEFEIVARPDPLRSGPPRPGHSDHERRIPRAGLLTPENSEVFLYSRAAIDGELPGMIAAAGPPVVRGEFDLYLHDGQLFYVRDGCRPEDREGLFILHLDPADPGDLGPFRRQYGFDNLSFRFHWRVLDPGERCVARVFLPDYDLSRIVTGRHPGRRFVGAEFAWIVEFVPPGRPGG